MSAVQPTDVNLSAGRVTQFLDGVQSVEEFRKLLERERAGCERNAHEFSLLVFDKHTDSGAVRDLLQTLRRRVRQIDSVGWLSPRQIGVLLPYTVAGGAQTLAQEICSMLPSPPKCVIYTYPGQWLPGEDGISGTRDHVGRSPSAPYEDLRTAREGSGDASPDAGKNHSFMRCGEWSDSLFADQIPIWKRTIDIIGALMGFVILFPLLLVVAIVIKTVSPGPVFLKQKRVGHKGRLFTIWKFRTMRANADTGVHENHFNSLIATNSPLTKLDVARDPRIFAFGRIIRKCYVDELPQLINVLLGDMSLVGPRPCIPYEAQAYEPWQTRRFDALPGMTGLWQVSGKNKTTFKEMVRLDIAYSRRRSLWLDIGILLKTVPAIASEVFSTHSRESRRGT